MLLLILQAPPGLVPDHPSSFLFFTPPHPLYMCIRPWSPRSPGLSTPCFTRLALTWLQDSVQSSPSPGSLRRHHQHPTLQNASVGKLPAPTSGPYAYQTALCRPLYLSGSLTRPHTLQEHGPQLICLYIPGSGTMPTVDETKAQREGDAQDITGGVREKLPLKGPDSSRYFRLVSQMALWQLFNSICGVQNQPQPIQNKWVVLCSNKTSFPQTAVCYSLLERKGLTLKSLTNSKHQR